LEVGANTALLAPDNRYLTQRRVNDVDGSGLAAAQHRGGRGFSNASSPRPTVHASTPACLIRL